MTTAMTIRSALTWKIDGLPLWTVAVRLIVLAFMLILVFYLGRDGAKFVYQGF